MVSLVLYFVWVCASLFVIGWVDDLSYCFIFAGGCLVWFLRD